ncbi:hybrid sensor histidine kinase/response regulator [Chondromyces crocatus]|nr:PAS domain-containing hybrid sensor histidine kinase/response regulator [Chondromyces crocatus]
MSSHDRSDPEEALRRLQQLVDGIPDAALYALVIRTDGSVQYEHASAGVERLSGIPAHEVLADANALLTLVLPDDLPGVRLRLKASLDSGEPFDCELRVRSRDGVVRWVRNRATVVKLPDGSTRITGLAVDESEHKQAELQREQAERARRTSEEALVAAQSIARLGGFRLHLPTRTVLWTDEMFRLLGRKVGNDPPSFDELIEMIHPEDRRGFLDALDLCGREGVPYMLEHRALRADGVVVHLASKGVSRRDATGKVVEIIGTAQDVTERVIEEQARARLEERLLQAQKLESLGLLAGGIAHDFNNLLTGVLTEASLVLDEVPYGSPVHGALRAIETSARRMSDLTKQLLAYAGGGPFTVERLDPVQLVGEMLELLRRNIGREVKLLVDTPRLSTSADTAVCVEADPTQLRQVVMNLVLNASDALQGRSGEVRIRSWIETGQNASTSSTTLASKSPSTTTTLGATVRPTGPGVWVLEVSDTGCGMTPETRRRIFDPFFTTKGRGRGLGLSAVQGIVRRMFGQIEVESEVDRGTTIRLRVPLTAGQAPLASTRETPSRAALQKLRVLVVDDEEAVRITLSRVLGRRGHTVAMAEDGSDAIETFRNARGNFDLVLLDISMPRKNGYEALEAIRNLRASARVVLMSGYSEAHLAGAGIHSERGSESTIDGFLEKPFAVEAIDRVLAEALRARGEAL